MKTIKIKLAMLLLFQLGIVVEMLGQGDPSADFAFQDPLIIVTPSPTDQSDFPPGADFPDGFSGPGYCYPDFSDEIANDPEFVPPPEYDPARAGEPLSEFELRYTLSSSGDWVFPGTDGGFDLSLRIDLNLLDGTGITPVVTNQDTGEVIDMFDWTYNTDTGFYVGRTKTGVPIVANENYTVTISGLRNTACADENIGSIGNLEPPAFSNINTANDSDFAYSSTVECSADPADPNYSEYCVTLLPVELIDFDGKLENNDAKLSWSTASEDGTEKFEIYRSFDGASYEKIAEQAAAGTTIVQQNYSLTDAGVAFKTSEEVVYYKLKTVDFDGSEELFDKVVALDIQRIESFKVYPSPAMSGADVTIEGTEIKTIEIYSMTGKLVDSYDFDAASKFRATVPTKGLQSGSYLVVINGEKQHKIIVGK